MNGYDCEDTLSTKGCGRARGNSFCCLVSLVWKGQQGDPDPANIYEIRREGDRLFGNVIHDAARHRDGGRPGAGRGDDRRRRMTGDATPPRPPALTSACGRIFEPERVSASWMYTAPQAAPQGTTLATMWKFTTCRDCLSKAPVALRENWRRFSGPTVCKVQGESMTPADLDTLDAARLASAASLSAARERLAADLTARLVADLRPAILNAIDGIVLGDDATALRQAWAEYVRTCAALEEGKR